MCVIPFRWSSNGESFVGGFTAVALQLTVNSTHLVVTARLSLRAAAEIYDRALDKPVSLQYTLLPSSLNLHLCRHNTNGLWIR